MHIIKFSSADMIISCSTYECGYFWKPKLSDLLQEMKISSMWVTLGICVKVRTLEQCVTNSLV